MRLGLAVLLLACGCGEVQVRRTLPGDFTTEGVRYWLPAPFLVVKTPVQVGSAEAIYQYVPGDNTLSEPTGAPAKTTDPSFDPKPTTADLEGGLWRLIKDTSKTTKTDDGGESGQVSNNPQTGSKPAKTTKADASSGDDTGAAPAPAATAASGLTIEWLPDYCQQYAIKQSAPGATSELALQFAQGWQLQTYNSKLDNTTLASKVIDAISSIVGDLAGGGAGKAAGGAKKAAGAADSSTQAATSRLLKKTTTWWLKPGVYPLYDYPLYDQAKALLAGAQTHEQLLHIERMICSGTPQLSVKAIPLTKTESWSELATSDSAAKAAAATK